VSTVLTVTNNNIIKDFYSVKSRVNWPGFTLTKTTSWKST